MWNPNCLNWSSWIHAQLGTGLVRIVAKRYEQKQLPSKFHKYVGIKAKNFPSIRSIIMARPGWCIVEADYKTAEMRGLAIISGDQDLTSLLFDPDTCFGLVKPDRIPEGVDAEDCRVRLKFPNYVSIPEDRDKFIMTYAADGEIKARFTEDDLLRDSDGNIVSPAFDMHWGCAELGYGKCREIMNKKRDRGGAKVINFCLAENTPVLTSTGYKPIQDITSDDLLWDGIAWVLSGGAVRRGEKNVITVGGITGTPDHIIYEYTDDGGIRGVPLLLCNPDKVVIVPATDKHYDRVCPRYIPESLLERVWDVEQQLAIQKYLTDVDSLDCLSDEAYTALAKVGISKQHIANANLCWSRTTTWDITDAGPRNRFSAANYLVHNSSSYGGQPASLARQVEVQTGVRMSVEDAETLLVAISKRQPRAEQFMREMEQIPKTTKTIRAASGRIRHCHTFSNDVSGVGTRTREGWLSALGRECRNYQLQESVGASASRACYWMAMFHEDNKEKYGVQGYPCVCLYDSIVVHCPEEERHLWAKALELYMYKQNGWVYGEDNRILRYDIDLEYNAGWSTAPDADMKAKLYDPEYKPLPEHMKDLMNNLESDLEYYTLFPELAVYNSWDFKQ